MIAVDSFCGLGGWTEGARRAKVRVVWAANHWKLAVDVHKANHPEADTVCQDVTQADWSSVPPHDLQLAAPACTGHTPARGKDKPHHDAMRATAWAVVDCAEFHRSYACVVENVPAFLKWSLYPAWEHAMKRLGYSVSPHVINAADHGVPQERLRLFLVCTRSKHPLHLILPKRPHRAVEDIIQWDAGRWSPIDKPGRSEKTLQRILVGRRQFGDRFVAPYYSSGSGLTGRSIRRPIGTIVTRDRWAVIDGDRMRMLSVPEALAAMSFQANYKLPAGHARGMFMLGNAVPPTVGRDVLHALQRAI